MVALLGWPSIAVVAAAVGWRVVGRPSLVIASWLDSSSCSLAQLVRIIPNNISHRCFFYRRIRTTLQSRPRAAAANCFPANGSGGKFEIARTADWKGHVKLASIGDFSRARKEGSHASAAGKKCDREYVRIVRSYSLIRILNVPYVLASYEQVQINRQSKNLI